MNGYQWLISLGARPDVLIACAVLGGITVLGAFIGRLMEAQRARRAGMAAGSRKPLPYPPVPASLRRGQEPPKAAPLPAGTRIAQYTVADIGSASLHAEHALCEARSDLHRALQRSTEAEIHACRRRFKTKLLAYMYACCAEYGMTFNREPGL